MPVDGVFQQGPDQDTSILEAGMRGGVAVKKQVDPAVYEKECADVRQWKKKIEEARKFDENARKRYAIDRSYARGDGGAYTVIVDIAQSYIDVLGSILFAKEPDLNISPAPSTEPPPQKELEKQAAKESADATQAKAQQLGAQIGPLVGQAAATGGLPQIMQQLQGLDPGKIAASVTSDVTPQAIAQQRAQPYQQRRADAKQIAATAELSVIHLWKQAGLKAKAKPLVKSALTVAIGWLKVTWQERTAGQDDPTMQAELDTLQERMAKVKALTAQMAEPGGSAQPDADAAELAQRIAGLQDSINAIARRGLAIDFVNAEDIQCSTDVMGLWAYLDCSWIAHRSLIPRPDGEAMFPDIDTDDWGKASLYYTKKPKDPTEKRDVGVIAADNMTAEDADSFSKGGGSDAPTQGPGQILVWEIWSRSMGMIVTVIEGIECYARQPYKPDPTTTRFYSFFQYPIGVIDGERHPRSLISRSCTLIDEYCAARSAWKKVRSRGIPKMGFDSTLYEATEIKKLEGATEQEFVGLKPRKPGAPIRDAVVEIRHAQVDAALYDTGPIRAELETIWAVQEALSSSIHTAKTATEAEIQDKGTSARTGFTRDDLDDMFTDLARYTTEIAFQKLSRDDVVEIAGAWALWPEGITPDLLPALLNVEVKAGSSGKPNTSARQQAWATLMPIISNGITQIGALRGSTPAEIADCQEELIIETINRTGERVDAERFLPDPPAAGEQPPPPPGPPQPMDEQAFTGQQVTAMTAVLTDVRAGLISPASAAPILMACFPKVDPQLISAMVAGVVPAPAPIIGAAKPGEEARPGDATEPGEAREPGEPPAMPPPPTVQ
jgi:hypothetical protein